MNTTICTGRLTANAISCGQHKKALKFTVAARYGYDKETESDRVEFVPCVLFSPSEGQEEYLTQKGKGLYIEFLGRIATSKYEKNGEEVYSTEVIVDKSTLTMVAK